MGNSAPPAADFDLVGSFARRRLDKVEIVLADPKLDLAAAPLLRLGQNGRAVIATGELTDDAAGRKLTVRAPRASFADGLWSLTVLNEGRDDSPVNARLLVQGERPLVLLWGAATPKRVVPPARLTRKRRVAAGAGPRIDRVLAVLPPARAVQVRGQIRSIARRFLG